MQTKLLRIRTEEKIQLLLKKMEKINGILTDAEKAVSDDQIELSIYLAKKAFEKKLNIAKKFKYEVLLWLMGKRDLKSAWTESMPKKQEMLVILFEVKKNTEKEIILQLNARKIPLKLRKKSDDALALERISLSRL